MSRWRFPLTLAAGIACALPVFAETPVPAHHDPVILMRQHMLDADINAFSFRAMDKFFETRIVAHGGKAWTLPVAKDWNPPSLDWGGERLSYEDWARRTYTNAVLVIHDGKIVFEDYRNRTTAQDRFISFSMAKSIVSLLIGIAHAEGRIASLDDMASAYVRELRGGGYDSVSIRQILQMRSGIDYVERYDFGATPSLAARIHSDAIVANRVRFADAARTIGRSATPGSRFNYATLDTAVLGWVLERATGEPLAAYMSEKLWRPAGMEADGFWIADGPPGIGRELSGMGFNARLRDYGRLGQLMLQDGIVDRRRILPAGWMREATTMLPFDQSATFDFGRGYGFQFWQVDGEPGAYAAVGLAGQFIYVHPASKTVIVKLSHFPTPEPPGISNESVAWFAAAARSFRDR
jgi:CubicO group peptidase (beta-lactamase class C family)